MSTPNNNISAVQPLNFTWGGDFKSIGDEGILEGSAIVFGSEESPDISSFKDFFTKETYVHPEEKFVTALYMEHGFSYDKPIGKAIMTKSDTGWVATAELNLDDPVVKSRFPEIKSGGWGFSTGAVGHVVKREEKKNGTHFISQWSVGELSITKTPAEPKALIHSVKSLDEYYSAFNQDTPMTDMPTDGSVEHDKLMEVIQMLITELVKKHIEEGLSPQLEEITKQLAELKSASLPIGSDEEINEKLTVLKSENETLNASIEELQSSFNEKEALLSEKMALLSETQEQLDVKNIKLGELEEELIKLREESEKTKHSLHLATEANRLLTKSNFKK